nr:retrovirus-related Pol polyprotein from transposon TNT 1-94 [Tanacetum cinerariifolium]
AAQILPANKKSILKNTNVLNPGMYKIHTDHTQTRTSKLPPDSRKTNKHVTFSTGVIPSTSVSRPQLKSNPIEDRVLRINSRGKKQEVKNHRRNVKLPKNKTSVTACNDSLNVKTLNVKSVSMCDKCVLHDKYDMCVLKSVAKPIKRTVASEPNKKPRNSTRKIYEHFSKTCTWWYPKSTPSGYIWKPKSRTENVNPNVSMPLGSRSRTANDLEPMTPRSSNVLNSPLKSTCFIHDLKGNDLLSGSRGTDLYSITLQDINSPNPICLVAKATSSQAWLCHRRLSHLNFDTINLLSKNDIVTLHVYFAIEGIQHQTSVARTPEQNGVVERRNRTLVEAARTMLSAAKVPLFFWAEAIATACFTQNRSLIIPRHEKKPNHIINDQKPSVKFFHIFGSVCYIVRGGENLDKMKEKGDECIFVGYSNQLKAYRVFNKRTRVIMESIHVNIDELPQMVSNQNSSDPAPECQTMKLNHDSLSPAIQHQGKVTQADRIVTTSNELDLLFSTMFDELLNRSSKAQPTEKHLTAVKRIFQYLKDTIHMGLWYPKDTGFELTAFSDSDHAGFLDSRKSTSGGIQFLGGDKLVSWSSNNQDCTSISFAKFEYVSLSACCAQVLWMRTQLTDYGFHFDKIPMYCGSKAAIAISCNPVQHSCTKHIDVCYYFIKEKVKKGIVELLFIGTEYQLADLFTKALLVERFKYLVRRLGMRCLTPAELEALANEPA